MAPNPKVREQTLTNNLCAAFCTLIREDLGKITVREINRRNAEEPHPNVCHSHDFCDANMYMAQAFEQVFKRPADPAAEDDARIWSTAWRYAVERKFGLSS